MRKRSARVAKPKVLLCTAISAGKEYVLPFLAPVLHSLAGADERFCLVDGCRLNPDLARDLRSCASVQYLSGRPGSRYEQLASMREACRQFFLRGKYTHLYFHDCDIIPPADIISRLLAHDTPVATGIYNRRNTNLPSPPLWGNWWEALGTDAAEHSLPSVAQMAVEGFGMGCMLIRRDVLEAISFRAGDAGEDWAFAQDCRDRLGVATMLDPSLSCWHVSLDGTANRLKIEEQRTAIVWTDTPHYVTKREGGAFERGVPRFDVAEHVIPTLGPGFVAVQMPGMSVEVKRAAEILP